MRLPSPRGSGLLVRRGCDAASATPERVVRSFLPEVVIGDLCDADHCPRASGAGRERRILHPPGHAPDLAEGGSAEHRVRSMQNTPGRQSEVYFGPGVVDPLLIGTWKVAGLRVLCGPHAAVACCALKEQARGDGVASAHGTGQDGEFTPARQPRRRVGRALSITVESEQLLQRSAASLAISLRVMPDADACCMPGLGCGAVRRCG